MPIEMTGPAPEREGRNFAIWVGNLAFRLYAAREQDALRVSFIDVTYLNYRYLETIPEHIEPATNYFFEMRDADEIGMEYRLRPGDRVTVGREAGMQVYDSEGSLIEGALSRAGSKMVQLDSDLAAVHFSVDLLQPHIAVVRDQSGEAGTRVEERPQPRGIREL